MRTVFDLRGYDIWVAASCCARFYCISITESRHHGSSREEKAMDCYILTSLMEQATSIEDTMGMIVTNKANLYLRE